MPNGKSQLRTGKVAALAATFFVVFGSLLAVRPLAAQDAANPQRVIVDSVAVVGNYRVSVAAVRALFGVQPGQTVTFHDIQKGTKTLMATGQYGDVTVTATDSRGDHAVLTLAVTERPQVRRVDINGLEHVKPEQVRDTTGLKAGEPYSPQEVTAAEALIRTELAKKGIPFADINEHLDPVAGLINVVDVVLDVKEGNRVTVAAVSVKGNEHVPEKEIVGAMAVQPEGFLWFKTGTYDATKLDADLKSSIPNVYKARGYLDFKVVDDTLVIDPKTGKARLDLSVDEGQQYRVANFTIEGNEEFPDTVLQRYFMPERRGLLAGIGLGADDTPETSGRVFDQVAFDAAAQQVRDLYANEGFLYAQVAPVVKKNPVAPGQAPTVDLTWQIREGLPAYIRRVAVVGNNYTYDWVVRDRLLLLPGDRYSQQRILQSYQSIGSLGFFETPIPPPNIVPDPETGDVDVTFVVKEKQTGSVTFGSSVGGGVGLSGFIGYEQPNLFGQAKSGHLRWDFGRYLNNFELSFSDPALRQSPVSGSISVFDSSDRFYQFSTGRRQRIGGSLNFGFPVPHTTRTRLFAGYSLAHTKYELFSDVTDTSIFGLPAGTQSTLLLGIVRNTVNHPVFPTLGSKLSWNAELNGGLLGGTGDFTKHTFEATMWVPTGQLGSGTSGGFNPRLALGLSLHGGAIFGDARNFPFDRFWMGGVQFGESLRGYDETTITPLGYFASGATGIEDVQRLGNAFLRFTAEYALRINDNISLSTFFDAGNVWSKPRDIDPTQLMRGAGVGVQLGTPFGPLGLDYAYGFDKAHPGWQLHFKMGQGGL
jgi:outer membrane protein insertion porin family